MCGCAQAGSDSLLTSATFLKLAQTFFAGMELMDSHRDVLYGLGMVRFWDELTDTALSAAQRRQYSPACYSLLLLVTPHNRAVCSTIKSASQYADSFIFALSQDGNNELTIHD